jgi:hypothetical protein
LLDELSYVQLTYFFGTHTGVGRVGFSIQGGWLFGLI